MGREPLIGRTGTNSWGIVRYGTDASSDGHLRRGSRSILCMQAVSDWPACAFAKELIEAYPEAKVILTVRDVDSWHKYRGPPLSLVW